MKIIIIGGGASGLLAATKLRNKHDVTILEANTDIGKKILMTGNGKCNYWHDPINKTDYYTDNYNNLETILNNNQKTYNYLETLGLFPTIKNGYYYPHSNESSTVVKILKNNLNNVNIITNCIVNDINKVNDKFIIKTTNNNEYTCDKLIISTGSLAYSKLEYNYSGYNLLKKYHTINKVLPSLVGLKSNYKHFKELDGVRVNSNISLYIDNCLVKQESGELQLTDYGISGICTFNISSLAIRNLNNKKDVKVNIDFLQQNFIDLMDKLNNNQSLEINLLSLLNHKIVEVIKKEIKLNYQDNWNNINNEDKLKLKEFINNLEINIIGYNSYDRSQVCSGGIPLSEINPNTMESLKVKDLYILGELLDVDGICGGYNLSFAFTTGFIVGEL